MAHPPLHRGKHATAVISECQQLTDLINNKTEVTLDGESLNVSEVVGVACYQIPASITTDPRVHAKLRDSVHHLDRKLANGEIIYGVNTGFGGSADTRTDDHTTLQQALIQHQASGVLLPTDRHGQQWAKSQTPRIRNPYGSTSLSMPSAMVRAAMLIRCNSLLRGHSAVRQEVIEHILAFLRGGLTPVVPLRGSISASGDLSPLSYIASALEGNPDISVRKDLTEDVMSADKALQLLGLVPLSFGPKEGLGLLNGTAFSCGAASLTLYQANQLVVLSQILTAMGTEALAGCRENYHPFIAEARPHHGQIEAASNIYALLRNSRLLKASVDRSNDSLAQDRYALRTASQWIGPQIEDMLLAMRQVHCEFNSTTDNPLIDPTNGHVHHGGNFQAAAITAAMGKIMNVMQMLGKMIFSQCSELINPALNNGLPPNLSFDDPSLSFTMKGVDINMAAYMSELSYLNHPVSNHVQSAEMHNQSLNSLALIASRYAAETVEVLSLMMAAYMYVLCQAVDLRTLQVEFMETAKCEINTITAEICDSACHLAEAELQHIQNTMWHEIMQHWARGSTSDLHDRSQMAARNSLGALVQLLPAPKTTTSVAAWLTAQHNWVNRVANALQTRYSAVREQFQANPTTKGYLCRSSRKIYELVRERLGVPLHRGIVDHPTYAAPGHDAKEKQCTGSQVSKIYTALREDEFREELRECWADSRELCRPGHTFGPYFLSPVAGTVVKVAHIPGTYFAADPSRGFENLDSTTWKPCPDCQAPDASLNMLALMATRKAIKCPENGGVPCNRHGGGIEL
ncbi:uncharacterized protein KD926_004388 [Aspergillus affinis]|uniref:uncharacterized protein n=1 Tax=Aspergillus affinis TaxID=1070780 RepID=UPI0022FEBCC5|nr:uncharacterized protein KD926_004388 [Aspergillus affinis]KAI9043204.1 hypothetical protein KD926_004388 [Aspergillus affinis]